MGPHLSHIVSHKHRRSGPPLAICLQLLIRCGYFFLCLLLHIIRSISIARLANQCLAVPIGELWPILGERQ